MSEKVALITGILGQDGSYLAEYLVSKGYKVVGCARRNSSFNTWRIDSLMKSTSPDIFTWEYADISDGSSINRLIFKHKPNEIYNLAAMSHVGISFMTPEISLMQDAMGTLKILDSIKTIDSSIRFYQASTSELFGGKSTSAYNLNSPLIPMSPYGVGKLASYHMTRVYRESYSLYCVNGILFNHESPRRGDNFVTKKIVKSLIKFLVDGSCLELGNIDAKRDWGHAKDYVKSMYLMLQQDLPRDYVISSGSSHSVREFLVLCCRLLGIDIHFKGEGLLETGYVAALNEPVLDFSHFRVPLKSLTLGQDIMRISERYYRPLEVQYLLGDSDEARSTLGWSPDYDLYGLAKDMLEFEISNARAF